MLPSWSAELFESRKAEGWERIEVRVERKVEQ